MRALAVCQDELVIRTLHPIMSGAFEVEFLVESRPLARRLVEDGIPATVADPKKLDTYVRADLTATTLVIVEDDGKKSLKKIVTAIRDAGGSLLYVLHVGVKPPEGRRAHDDLKTLVPELTHLDFTELLAGALTTELSRSLTRMRVQQYQRYMQDADRVLILLHNDPDPDALAAGLAMRNVLRRTKTTAIIGCLQGVTRPENQRMVDMLDIKFEIITPEHFAAFDRIVTVDVQPHYFGGLLPRVDLVVDHHPEQTGYNAVFKDIRTEYGSTCTILTEHLRAVDIDISERTATAMLYAIKSDTLFFSRHTNRVDLEAFTYLYPLADAALIRKMEGAEITIERLEYVTRALHTSSHRNQVFSGFLGETTREDLIAYTADFFLQLEDVKWTMISGVVNGQFIMSVRNLGYTRNAGEFVKKYFNDIGSAGGHRAMAKAVVPITKFRDKFGDLSGVGIAARVGEMAEQFLQDKSI